MANFALNKENLVNRQDYGIRVARPGYNALNCADNQLLFNSNWPILQIVDVLQEVLLETDGSVSDEAIFLSENEIKFDYCACTSKEVFSRYVEKLYFDNNSVVTVTLKYGCKHNLGYPPLAFPSTQLSEVSGYIVLTSIDISTDADYPYTDQPVNFVGKANDYGIKSKAYYKKKMPLDGEIAGYGINTNLSSKMLQAVKTLESAVEYTDPNNIQIKQVTWAPPKDENNNPINGVEDFEYFAFGSNTDIYEPVDAKLFPIGGSTYDAEYVVATTEQSDTSFTGVSSLVVLRSPMIAPEIKEVTYGS